MSTNIQRARVLATKATVLEQQKKREEAVIFYDKAIKLFLRAIIRNINMIISKDLINKLINNIFQKF
jgi:hypothetical protein